MLITGKFDLRPSAKTIPNGKAMAIAQEDMVLFLILMLQL